MLSLHLDSVQEEEEEAQESYGSMQDLIVNHPYFFQALCCLSAEVYLFVWLCIYTLHSKLCVCMYNYALDVCIFSLQIDIHSLDLHSEDTEFPFISVRNIDSQFINFYMNS